MIDWVLSSTGSSHSLELSETEAGWRSQSVGDCCWQVWQALACKSPAPTSASVFTRSPCVSVSKTSPFYKDTTCIRLGPDFLNTAPSVLNASAMASSPNGVPLTYAGIRSMTENYRGPQVSPYHPLRGRAAQGCLVFHCDLHSRSCSLSHGKKVAQLEGRKPAAMPR